MCPSYLLCIHSFLIQPCITYFGSLSKHTQFRALGQLNYEERVAQIRTLTYYRWSFCLTRSRAAYHVTNVTKVYGFRARLLMDTKWPSNRHMRWVGYMHLLWAKSTSTHTCDANNQWAQSMYILCNHKGRVTNYSTIILHHQHTHLRNHVGITNCHTQSCPLHSSTVSSLLTVLPAHTEQCRSQSMCARGYSEWSLRLATICSQLTLMWTSGTKWHMKWMSPIGSGTLISAGEASRLLFWSKE